MPKVSVVIPTHNRPDLLLRALASVYAQTFQDFEVIVVDDGDSPTAESVLAEYRQKPNFRYLETNKNQGAPVARNIGIKEATGEFVAFLDDDDKWEKVKLKRQVEVLETHEEVGAVFTQSKGVKIENNVVFLRPSHLSGMYTDIEDLLAKCSIWTSALMYRKKFADEGYIFDETLKKNQEWDLELRLLQVTSFYAIAEPLTIINVGSSGQMGGVANISNIAAGYQRFMDKHEGLYSKYPQAHTKRLFHLGCLHYQSGNVQQARKVWGRVLKLQPYNIVCLKHYATSFMPILYRFLHKNVV